MVGGHFWRSSRPERHGAVWSASNGRLYSAKRIENLFPSFISQSAKVNAFSLLLFEMMLATGR
jgi:hypothetical protein